ncbi:right-handed parallel beta-helix repeat-containing protein, partial [Candidatus Parcubacteria bacterium]|nr:right-handed parallel beta-helix repeat-containing protein [Candidatus Parcubacteria bacterium]
MKLSLPKAFSIIFFEFFIAILFNFPLQALLAENSVIFLPEDCSKYGIWDASTSVCTLQQDLKGSVEIKSDNITLDCAYHQIEGAGTGKGILIEKRKGVTIQNCKITNFSLGISMVFSSGNNLFRNEVFGNNFGIEIFGSCPDFISRENTLTENHVYSNKTSGIIFRCSYSNKLIKNNIENNGNTGLLLSGSDNFLRENSISNHQYNFGVERALWSKNFTNRQDIDTSNTINGKPIYFLVNEENKVIDSSFNPGYIGLVNSQNITIRDITLSQNVQGIYFDHTTNSKIENVKLLNNSTGLDFHVSSNNLISESEISENLDGILLWLSNENIITKNFISLYK